MFINRYRNNLFWINSHRNYQFYRNKCPANFHRNSLIRSFLKKNSSTNFYKNCLSNCFWNQYGKSLLSAKLAKQTFNARLCWIQTAMVWYKPRWFDTNHDGLIQTMVVWYKPWWFDTRSYRNSENICNQPPCGYTHCTRNTRISVCWLI